MRHKSFRFSAACGIFLLLTDGTQGRLPTSAVPSGTGTGCLTASFSGIQGHNGYLRVSLFGSRNSFPDGVPLARRDISLPALGPQALHPLKVTFTGLHPGKYAVCAFHDRDGSGKLSQDFLGIPTEEWGMSNNPRPQFRAPRFDEAQIGVDPRGKRSISIRLHT